MGILSSHVASVPFGAWPVWVDLNHASPISIGEGGEKIRIFVSLSDCFVVCYPRYLCKAFDTKLPGFAIFV